MHAVIDRIESALPPVLELPIGGTAVGPELNSHPRFSGLVVALIRRGSGLEFTLSRNFFAGISSQDASLELSAQLRGLAVALLKISNDLCMMNSGPAAGHPEISLPALQAGSSIMAGKLYRVIPEAAALTCAQVVGNDGAILVAAQSGSSQHHAALPCMEPADQHSTAYQSCASPRFKGHFRLRVERG